MLVAHFQSADRRRIANALDMERLDAPVARMGQSNLKRLHECMSHFLSKTLSKAERYRYKLARRFAGTPLVGLVWRYLCLPQWIIPQRMTTAKWLKLPVT